MSNKKIELTEKQVWFIKCACEAKTAVLPLQESQLAANTFEEDYGYTQKELIEEIDNLKKLL